MTKTDAQLARDISRTIIASFDLGRGQYRVTVAIDPSRGGFIARLISLGIGVLQSADGPTPQAAAARLAKDMREGALTSYDRMLAKELKQRLESYQHSWGAR